MLEEYRKEWELIREFEIDDLDSVFKFTDRLSRENGWKTEYSIRVIYEYKKFIFLLTIAEQALTPSDQIDQAWHLHLLYTDSYWNKFCKNLLGKEIHHNPTQGGKQEGEKYINLYQNTIEFYKTIFQKDPPIDIWPSSDVRFARIEFRRIDVNRNWLIKTILKLRS
jgi:hypothetical protein